MEKNDKSGEKEELKPEPGNSQNENGFESVPGGPKKEININPSTSKETQIPGAGINDVDKKTHRRKRIYKNKKIEIDEQQSDGSANAFDGK